MLDLLITFVAFIVAISVLVAFHEYGHFWMARRCGVKVLRFSVGFGKPLWSRVSKAGTEYVIALIPLGGYVKMLESSEPNLTPAQKQQAFDTQPVGKRFAIVAAGPIFNFIFAIAAFWCVFLAGVEQQIPYIGEIMPRSIADKAGLKTGQEILQIGDVKTNSWPAVVREMVPFIGEQSEILIQTESPSGEQRLHRLDLSQWQGASRHVGLFESLGIEPLREPLEPLIESVVDNEPAQIGGLRPGDLIISANDEAMDDWNVFVKVIHENALKPIFLQVKRGGQLIDLEITPRIKSVLNDPDKGYLGIKPVLPDNYGQSLMRLERYNPLEALQISCVKTWDYITMTFMVLGKMVTQDISIDNISGPVSIAKMAGSTAQSGWEYFFGFLAIISISLGVLNLLPIPILDGGHLLYYVIEIITQKPVSAKVQLLGYKLGLFVIIFLMTVALYNDIVRMF